jgi:hypothetical protein
MKYLCTTSQRGLRANQLGKTSRRECNGHEKAHQERLGWPIFGSFRASNGDLAPGFNACHGKYGR